jgi:hypothetical protein
MYELLHVDLEMLSNESVIPCSQMIGSTPYFPDREKFHDVHPTSSGMLPRRIIPFAQQRVSSLHPFSRRLATVVNPRKLPFDETCTSITPPYKTLVSNLKTVKKVLDNEPLTLAEKILYSHLSNVEESLAAGKGNIRGQSYLKLNPDRVAMQGSPQLDRVNVDASAQMAILQFMASGLDRTAVPTSIHCDHLIVGNKGAKVDLEVLSS